MRRLPALLRDAFLLLGLLALLSLALPSAALSPLVPPAQADDPPSPEPTPRPEGPGVPGGKPETPPLHKVYVPYKDLQKVFEKEGQGVFVPYAEFRALWEKAYRMPDDPTRPPVPAAVRSASYVGVAEAESVRFTASLELEVLAKGWQRLALNFGGVGIEQATIAGQPALLVPTEKGYDLLLEGEGRRTLDLVFRAGAPPQGDTYVADLALPPVPLARLSLRVPGADTDVQVTPRLAGSTGKTADGATELLAFLGPVSNVKLTWRRRPDEGPKVDPLVFGTEATDVLVDRGVVRTEFLGTLSILRAPLERLTLVVPADAVVLYVEGPGLRTWERNAAGDRIALALREPVKERWEFKVGLERALKTLPAEVPLPLVSIEGLERETGFLRLRAAEGVKVDPKATPGLVQADLSELPDPLKGAVPGKAFGWRHPGRPGAVTAAVEALAPRVTALVGNRVGLKPEGIDVRATAQVTVERAGVFGVVFDLPADLEVTDVALEGAELDDWGRQVVDGQPALRVTFRDRLLGTATVTVAGRRALAVPEEEGKEATLEVPILRLRAADHVRGYLAVHADPALDRREVETSRKGLTVLETGAAGVIEPPALPDPSLPLGARFEHREGAVAYALVLKRKAATVQGFVETRLTLEPDRSRIELKLRWLVQFRGVDTFRFRGPLDLAKRVHVDPGPQQAGMDLLDPVPEDKPEGAPESWTPTRGTWTLRLSAPRQGWVEVPMVVDDKPETALAAGAAREVALPVFVPMGADGKPLSNLTLHAAVQRDPLLEVATSQVEKGEEIDPRELEGRTGLLRPDTFLAFRSYDPEHVVRLTLTKHEYEPVAQVVVSHTHLNTVVPPEGEATTEAFLVVRNNDRQFLEVRLPEGASLIAVNVDGKPESPRRGEDGSVRIPLLANLRKDQAFVVAFVYKHSVARSGALFETVRLAAPEVAQVTSDLLTWRVFAPEERTYTGFGGDVERAASGGSWALSLLQNVSGLLGRTPRGQPLDLKRMIADAERGSPFKVPAVGTEFLFTNRTGRGEVTLTSAPPTAFLFLRLALLAGAFVGLRVLLRVARGLGLGALATFLTVALALLLLLVPAGPGLSALLTSVFLGVLLSASVSFLAWVARGRSQAAARTTPTPPAAAPQGAGGAA